MAVQSYLCVEEVAELFGITPSTVYRMAQEGALPGFKVRSQWRFSRSMLDLWVADQVTVKWLKAENKKTVSHKKSIKQNKRKRNTK